MRRTLRLAIVGNGAIAHDYLAALAEVDEIALVAIVDAGDVARARARERANLAVHASVAELLRATEFDAALVLTPPATHESITTELLQAGKHVLCEKPLATSTAAAARMLRVAAQQGRMLMMASKFRYGEDVTLAQQLVERGAIGMVVSYENSFCSRVDMTRRWNADAALSGGGVLIDHGAHAVDLARVFLGPLARVLACVPRRVQELPVEDSARVVFEASSGAVGTADLSWSLHKEIDWYVALHGSLGTLQLGWRGSRYKLAQGDWVAFGRGYDKRRAFAAQLRNFARTWQGTAEPAILAEDAFESVRAIDACYRSLRTGGWVELARKGG